MYCLKGGAFKLLIIALFMFPLSQLKASALTDSTDWQQILAIPDNSTPVDTMGADSSVDFNTFYNDLSSSGDWIKITSTDSIDASSLAEDNGYNTIDDDIETGWVWRPYMDDFGWYPYTNGCWEYTDYGWMWVSYYNWGWGPYHYGRWWWHHRWGWVWSPGYVWAPAWVCWRNTSGYVGWYPISPRVKVTYVNGKRTVDYNYNLNSQKWVFMNKNKFTENNIEKSSFAGAKTGAQLFSRSRPISGVEVEGRRIVDRGPNVQSIERYSGRTIQQKHVQPMEKKGPPVRTGNEVKIYKRNDNPTISRRVYGSRPHYTGNRNPGNRSPGYNNHGNSNRGNQNHGSQSRGSTNHNSQGQGNQSRGSSRAGYGSHSKR